MGTDISEGAKVGIILVILCALIAIVFSLLTMMKNITSSGSQSLQNGLDQLTDSEFQSYDQENVSGTDVMAAVKIFEGRTVGFVVVSQADIKDNGGQANGATGHWYGAKLTAGQAVSTNTAHSGNNAGDVGLITVKSTTGSEPTDAPTDAITKYEGNAYYTGAIDMSTGAPQYNMNVRPMSVTGTRCFVRSSAKFLAELIKDPTGTKVGVCFTQVN